MTTELEAVDVTIQAEPAQPAPEGAPIAAGVPVKSAADEWAELPKMFGSIVSAFPPLKELREVYTDANCASWGAAMAPIAEARGWTAAAALAWLGPWVQLALATHTLVTPTAATIARVIREAREAKERAAAEAKKPEAPAPA